MDVLVTSMNKKDRNKNKGARVPQHKILIFHTVKGR